MLEPRRAIGGRRWMAVVGLVYITFGLVVPPPYGPVMRFAHFGGQFIAAGILVLITASFFPWRPRWRAAAGAAIVVVALQRGVLLLFNPTPGVGVFSAFIWLYLAWLTAYAWPFILPPSRRSRPREA